MLISIITVVFNDESGLTKTIDSIRTALSNIEYNVDVEFIVVDGLSSDGTLEKIQSSRDVISSYVSELDYGIYDAMNKGLEISKGDWVYFLNAGDVFDNGYVLDKLIYYISLASQKTNLLYGRYRTDGVVQDQNCSLKFLVSHMLNHQSVLYRRSLIDKGYDIRYKFCADYAHLISNWCQIRAEYVEVCIANYDTTGVSSQGINKAVMWQERLHAVWKSNLRLSNKIILSTRGLVAWPYHYFKLTLMKCKVSS